MITLQEVKKFLVNQDVDFEVGHWGPVTGHPVNIWRIVLGDVCVSLQPLCRILLIGDCVTVDQLHDWDDWFRFDETDIEFRGVDLAWWCNHKPVLQELVQLIESKISKTEPVSKPANCRPDICPQ